MQSITPGRVFEDMLILGSATNEGYSSGPGDIRAFDVRTGKLVWTFHTIPHPGEFGYDTWPKDAWKTVGGVNVWGEFSIDEKRGIVYAPTASPKYNFYGANRKGAGLFGDWLLALDARTGKRLWHFQMVHHDIWDYDDATAPKLLTVRHDGKTVDVVAQVSKQGFIWVFNRVTGEPLWPIEERPVPKSDMPEEEAWPTQPFPTAPPPFARQKFTVDDLSPYLTPEDRARFRDEMLSARNEGLFTPPGSADRPDAGEQRWRELGRRGGGSRPWKLLRGLEGPPGDAEARARTPAAPDDGAVRQRLQLHDCEQRSVADRAALVEPDGVRPQHGDDLVEDPARRCAPGCRIRVALPEGGAGGDGHGADLHGHARQADSRARCRDGQGPLAEAARYGARRNTGGVRSRGAAIHRLLRRCAVWIDASDRGETERLVRGVRVAEGRELAEQELEVDSQRHGEIAGAVGVEFVAGAAGGAVRDELGA